MCLTCWSLALKALSVCWCAGCTGWPGCSRAGACKGQSRASGTQGLGQSDGDLIEAIDDIVKGQDIRAATPGPWLSIGLPEQQLAQLCLHFHKV